MVHIQKRKKKKKSQNSHDHLATQVRSSWNDETFWTDLVDLTGQRCWFGRTRLYVLDRVFIGFWPVWSHRVLCLEGLHAWLRGFPGGAVVKTLPANAEDARDEGAILGSGRYPGVGNGAHSSILAWKIPWTQGPGMLTCHGVTKSQIAHTQHIVQSDSLGVFFRNLYLHFENFPIKIMFIY